jgi:hypothetical protein
MRVPIPEDHTGRAAYLAERAAALRAVQCRSPLTHTTRARCGDRAKRHHQVPATTHPARTPAHAVLELKASGRTAIPS